MCGTTTSIRSPTRWMCWSGGCGARSSSRASGRCSTPCEVWDTCCPSGRPRMPLSRLRLRLAGSFALTFLAGLTALNVALFFYIRHQSDQRLTRHLHAVAADVVDAVRREYQDVPPRPLANAARSALEEWPPGPEGIIVYGDDARVIAQRGDSGLTRLAPSSFAYSAPALTGDLAGGQGQRVRLTTT